MKSSSDVIDEFKSMGLGFGIDKNDLVVYGKKQGFHQSLIPSIKTLAAEIYSNLQQEKIKNSSEHIIIDIKKILTAQERVKDVIVLEHPLGESDSYFTVYVVADSSPVLNQDDGVAKGIAFSLFYFGAEPDSTTNKYDFYLNAGKLADKYNFEAIWTPERHFDPVGGLYPNPSILSAALAAITSRIQLRAGSIVLPLHDCLRVAEEWSVVDNISNGRVGVAIASGWHVRDFVLAPENFSSRKDVMFNSIETLNELWKGKSIIRKDGRNGDVDVQIFPKPLQKQLPLWITAANNPATFVEAGRLGANVLTHLLDQTIEQLAEKIQLYKRALVENGHNPKSGKVTVMIHTFIGEKLEETIDYARPYFLKYMEGHISLILALFDKSNVPVDSLDKEDLAAMAEFAFQRYLKSASLIGTPESASKVVNALKDVGVDELACLIDWIDSDAAYNALNYLQQLRLRYCGNLFEEGAFLTSVEQLIKNEIPDFSYAVDFVLLESIPRKLDNTIDYDSLQSCSRRHLVEELFRIAIEPECSSDEFELII